MGVASLGVMVTAKEGAAKKKSGLDLRLRVMMNPVVHNYVPLLKCKRIVFVYT